MIRSGSGAYTSTASGSSTGLDSNFNNIVVKGV